MIRKTLITFSRLNLANIISKMTTVDSLTTLLKGLSINLITHPHVEVGSDKAKTWSDALKFTPPPSNLGDFVLTKTMLIKPKSKEEVPPLLVIAAENRDIPVNPLAKSLGYKEARIANDDFVNSTLGVSKIGGTVYIRVYYKF